MDDRANYLALALLGCCAVLGVVGAIWLSLAGQKIPDVLNSIVSICLGVLGGYVARSAEPRR